MSNSIAVIGAGGWGIALAKLLSEKGRDVSLWCHGAENYRELTEKRESGSYLPGRVLPPAVKITQSLNEAVMGKELMVCAVPSHAVREVMSSLVSFVGPQ